MDTLLEVQALSKRFPGVQALDKVGLDVRRGEIHGLIGENGAGKSTLIKIIAGACRKDAGDMLFDGRPFNPASPTHALHHGIAVVYQELSMCENMSVAENLFINRHPTFAFMRWIDRKTLFRASKDHLKKFDLDVSPTDRVGDLSLAVREQVEILRALSYKPKLIILDEPTGPLNKPLVDRLFELLGTLKEEHVSVLYISHNISEVLRICDRVTVLRDGSKVATRESTEVNEEQLSGMMVGRKLDQIFPGRQKKNLGDVVLKVEGLSARGLFKDVSFDLRRGEVLGFAGLIGARRTETALTIFGSIAKSAGQIFIDGARVEIRSPADAIASGIAYLPEDRKLLGLFLPFTISENLLSLEVKRYSRLGILDRKRILQDALLQIEKMKIKASGPNQVVGTLSGGNQQKTLLAKWISLGPKVLIIDEPTRGIDIGAKQAIHELVRDLANSGIGVILISSELPEVLGMSDRLLILDRGEVVEIADNDGSITEEYVMSSIVRYKRGRKSS